MKKVLAIDGGGIRGIIPAIVLEYIMDRLRIWGPASSVFDLIVGTSVGGVLSLIQAATDYSPTDTISFFTAAGPKIFHRPLSHKLRTAGGLLGPKYPSEPLRRAAAEYLGDFTLKDCRADVVITSYDIERRETVLFKSRKAKSGERYNHKLVDVAMATAKAPTFFEPQLLDDGGCKRTLVDGGVSANTPVMVALTEAKTLWPDEEILLVSIGTGDQTRPIFGNSWGLTEWAPHIINVLMDGGNDVSIYEARQLLGYSFYRIQSKLTEASDDMDDASPKNLRLLELHADETIKQHEYELNSLCERLTNH